jgi:hypothetical protein
MAEPGEVVTSRTIAASPDRIWGVISDLRRLPDWTDLEERGWQVVELDPPRCLVLAGRLPLIRDATCTVELAAAGTSTEVTCRLRFRPALGRLGSVVHGPLARQARSRGELSLERLQGLFQRQPAP